MDRNRLLQWLRAVPDDDEDDGARKRMRSSDRLPTPPTMEPPDKRRRIGRSASTSSEPATAAQRLRALQLRGPSKRVAAPAELPPPWANPSSPIPGHISSSNMTSEASGSNVSLGKKRTYTQRGPEPVNVRTFGKAVNLPQALNALLADIKKVNAGAMPFISHSRRDEIRRSDEAGEEIFENHFLPEGAGQDQVESPPLEDVTRIIQMAGEFAVLHYDEHAWNCGVHFPLLQLAIPSNSLFKIIPCTTARISDSQFIPASVPNGKMVDFCLAIDPYWPLGWHFSTPASAAVEKASLSQPGFSINPTAYGPLAQYPIALSIQTRRQNGDGEEAEAQLGVWQTAQWKMFETIINGPPASTRACFEELGFLPGIIIVGHEWRFAATTRDPVSGRTTLWNYQSLGNTVNALGIYRIIWGLRRLQKFLTEIYWPWYQKYVLDMGGGSDG